MKQENPGKEEEPRSVSVRDEEGVQASSERWALVIFCGRFVMQDQRFQLAIRQCDRVTE